MFININFCLNKYVQKFLIYKKNIAMYVHNYIIFEYIKKSYMKFTVRYDNDRDNIR